MAILFDFRVERRQQFNIYRSVTSPTQQQVKICFAKTVKTAARFFSTRFLGIFSLPVYLKMPKNRPVSGGKAAISRKKRPTVTAYEKSRVSAKK
jgi:hypothetical protein